ncbi:hypothetical protein GCM10009817_24210 [Terrabacter lapilli]|uniref:Uncharacterized protein n=1 Tax=Terrabacter lapilli TaxID=436231 RepID=A0ABN2S9C5_9MICO
MARRPTGSASVGQLLAAVACCLVLATGCTGSAAPGPGTGDSGSTSAPVDRSTSPTGAGGGAGSGGDTASPSGGDTASPSGGAGDGGGAGGQAPGSPIDVPTIPQKDEPMSGLRDAITSLFVEACGGSGLCVQLEFGDGACFVGYDPATQARRGSKVRVLTESQEECDRARAGGGSTTTTDGTPEPGSPTGPPTGDTSPGTTGTPTGGSTPDGGQSDVPTG